MASLSPDVPVVAAKGVRVSPDGHVLVRPDEIDLWDEIRPPDWSTWHLAIGHEVCGDGWVKVLWEVDRGDAPGAFTMFEAHEVLERR